MPKFKKNTSPAMKKSAYKMRYQGSHSAFPFKSPLHDHEEDADGNIIEHPVDPDAPGTPGEPGYEPGVGSEGELKLPIGTFPTGGE